METAFENMFEQDKELPKVAALNTLHPPMLEESIEEFRRLHQHATEEFCEVVFERHTSKTEEIDAFMSKVEEAKEINVQEGIVLIQKFDLLKKKATVSMEGADKGARADTTKALDASRKTLRNELMALEITLVEQLEVLIAAFEQAHKKIADVNVEAYNDYFGKCRDLETARPHSPPPSPSPRRALVRFAAHA